MITHVQNNLYRSERPRSVQELKDAGIQIVISLQSGMWEFNRDDEYEIEKVISALVDDITYIEIDHFALLPPKRADVELALRVIRQNPGKKVLVHCKAGKDRTGYVCAVYRMQDCKWSLQEAVNEMLQMGQHFRYRFWILSLRKYLP